MKFEPARAHLPCPVPSEKTDMSLHEPLGRAHYPPRMDEQRGWKPSQKIGCMIPIKEPRPQGCKQINFKPAEVKVHMDRKHFTPKYKSLEGVSYENQRPALRMFAVRHQPTALA